MYDGTTDAGELASSSVPTGSSTSDSFASACMSYRSGLCAWDVSADVSDGAASTLFGAVATAAGPGASEPPADTPLERRPEPRATCTITAPAPIEPISKAIIQPRHGKIAQEKVVTPVMTSEQSPTEIRGFKERLPCPGEKLIQASTQPVAGHSPAAQQHQRQQGQERQSQQSKANGDGQDGHENWPIP